MSINAAVGNFLTVYIFIVVAKLFPNPNLLTLFLKFMKFFYHPQCAFRSSQTLEFNWPKTAVCKFDERQRKSFYEGLFLRSIFKRLKGLLDQVGVNVSSIFKYDTLVNPQLIL